MAQKRYTERQIDELDGYLQSNFNHEIYGQLTGEEHQGYNGLFEPLKFFRLFKKQVAFVEANKARPLFTAQTLENSDLTDEQLWYLLFKLGRFFESACRKDEPLRVSCAELRKLMGRLVAFEDPPAAEIPEDPFDFDKVREHLTTLATYREKIAYLIEQRYQFEQQNSHGWDLSQFGRNCKLEVEKLEKLARLQEPKTKIEEPGKHPDARLDRVALALNYLLSGAGVKEDIPKSKRINFIDFVSPYSKNTIKRQLDSLHEKASDNPAEYKKDMMLVRGYFEQLKLSKIVEQVDRDLALET